MGGSNCHPQLHQRQTPGSSAAAAQQQPSSSAAAQHLAMQQPRISAAMRQVHLTSSSEATQHNHYPAGALTSSMYSNRPRPSVDQ